MDEAVRLMRQAAEQGHIDAQDRLGIVYNFGQGVKQSYSEVSKWFRKAAEQGLPQAQFNLGSSYYDGEGVEQSYSKAAKRYRKAADQGLADAQYALAEFYMFGRRVLEMSRAKAVELLTIAANQGHQNAQDLLVSLRTSTPPQGACASCGAESAPLKCSRCKAIMYCSKACQVEHWKRGGHRGVFVLLCDARRVGW